MPEHDVRSTDTKAGTIGGMLWIFLLHIGSREVLQTMVLSAVGAIVSYCVSVGMRWLFKKLKQSS